MSLQRQGQAHRFGKTRSFILPEHVFLSLVSSLALLLLHRLPQPTAHQLLTLRPYRLLRCDVASHPCVLPASAALDALAQRGTLSQELLLPCAPHLIQVDGPFPLTEPSGCNRPAAEEGYNFVSLRRKTTFRHLRVFVCVKTCDQAVCTLRLHSGHSSPSHKCFPSHHGDKPRLDPPFCCCHRQDAPGDLTNTKQRNTYSSLLSLSVKCHLQPGASLFYSHFNGLCVYRRYWASGVLRR